MIKLFWNQFHFHIELCKSGRFIYWPKKPLSKGMLKCVCFRLKREENCCKHSTEFLLCFHRMAQCDILDRGAGLYDGDMDHL